jgi:hypothetical protein
MERRLIRPIILILLFLLAPLAVASAEACEIQGGCPNCRMGQEECVETAGKAESSDAGMVASAVDETGCPHGRLCCGDGGLPMTSVISGTIGSYSCLFQNSKSFTHVASSLAVTATLVVKPPLYQIPPLYIRNCSFLI